MHVDKENRGKAASLWEPKAKGCLKGHNTEKRTKSIFSWFKLSGLLHQTGSCTGPTKSRDQIIYCTLHFIDKNYIILSSKTESSHLWSAETPWNSEELVTWQTFQRTARRQQRSLTIHASWKDREPKPKSYKHISMHWKLKYMHRKNNLMLALDFPAPPFEDQCFLSTCWTLSHHGCLWNNLKMPSEN